MNRKSFAEIDSFEDLVYEIEENGFEAADFDIYYGDTAAEILLGNAGNLDDPVLKVSGDSIDEDDMAFFGELEDDDTPIPDDNVFEYIYGGISEVAWLLDKLDSNDHLDDDGYYTYDPSDPLGLRPLHDDEDLEKFKSAVYKKFVKYGVFED